MKYLALALVLIGCGRPTPPEFTSALGTHFLVVDNIDFDPSVVDEIETALAQHEPAAFECLPKLTVNVMQRGDLQVERDALSAEHKDVLGFITDNNARVATHDEFSGEVWHSSLLHEEMHWMLNCGHGNSDHDHKNKQAWDFVRDTTNLHVTY